MFNLPTYTLPIMVRQFLYPNSMRSSRFLTSQPLSKEFFFSFHQSRNLFPKHFFLFYSLLSCLFFPNQTNTPSAYDTKRLTNLLLTTPHPKLLLQDILKQ